MDRPGQRGFRTGDVNDKKFISQIKKVTMDNIGIQSMDPFQLLAENLLSPPIFALPEANPGYYITASLGITFPFNLAIGVPVYFWLARTFLAG